MNSCILVCIHLELESCFKAEDLVYFLAGSWFITKFPTWESVLEKFMFSQLNSILKLKKWYEFLNCLSGPSCDLYCG